MARVLRLSSLIATVALVAVALPSIAGLPAPATASLQFDVGVPQGEFHHYVRNPGFGLSAQAEYGPENLPLRGGCLLGFLVYGSQTRGEIETENTLVDLDLILKVAPQVWRFRPYASALGGVRLLYTKSELVETDQDPGGSDGEVPRIDQADVTLTYGGAAGLQFLLWEGMATYTSNDRSEKKPFSFFLDLGARYLRGGHADYLRKGDVHGLPEEPTYRVRQSRTDLLTFQLGFAVDGLGD